MSGWIILGLIILAILYAIHAYNRLIQLKNRYQNAFSQIEVQLKRRYDLIPNLMETAKAYMKHERETLQTVIAARNSALQTLQNMAHQPDPKSIEALSTAEQTLRAALGQFNIAVEAYPELKADQTMQQFSEELTSTENKISFARQAYNDAVTEYNTYQQSFPPVLLANLFGHQKASLLKIEAKEWQAPQVFFN